MYKYKTIVNKHVTGGTSITREYFHEIDNYAQGEIIIVNDEEPSIYVLDNNGIPKQISGGNQNGGNISPEVLEEIKKQIQEGDDEILSEVDELSGKVEGFEVKINTNTQDIAQIKPQITKINYDLQNIPSNLQEEIIKTKDNILEHTVNGIAIKKNPVLDANIVHVDNNYGGTIVPDGSSESIQNNETIQIALKKIENMIFANTLAITASLNDLHRRITNLESIINVNENPDNIEE